jgi:hypothetical protein
MLLQSVQAEVGQLSQEVQPRDTWGAKVRQPTNSARLHAVKSYIYFGCCAQNKAPVMASVTDLIRAVET